ncbi:MAG TPA: hypothetical protein VIN05_06635 [Roseovarius sp.]
MSITIVRRSDFLHRLTPETVVTPDDAFIDRIDLSIGNWALLGDSDAICSALEHLRRETLTVTPYGEVLQIFQGDLIEHIHDVRHLRFTANPNADRLNRAHTLVSGSVGLAGWGNRQNQRLDNEKARIVFRAQLNLTRFIQAQHLKRATRLDTPKLASDYVLAITPESRWYRDEAPLLPATNVIIGPDLKYAYALKSSRQAQFRRYLKLIHSMLHQSLGVAFEDEDAEACQLPNLTLHQIEFYWEFDHDNPIDYVVSIVPRLRQQAADVREDQYLVSLPEYSISCQSPCIKLALTRTIELKVYAKTNRRVRFEITFKDRAIGTYGGGQTATTAKRLVSKIAPLAEEAARRCNEVLQSITAAPPPPSTISAFQLMHAIYQKARSPYVAETVIAGLLAFERITPYGNDPLKETIHALRDAGILRTSRPRSRVYVVTNEYSAALQRLRELR